MVVFDKYYVKSKEKSQYVKKGKKYLLLNLQKENR